MSYLSIEHLDKSFVRGNLASQVLKDINLNIAKGMALHLRFHPFTRSDVQRGMGMIEDLCLHRERRNLARTLLKSRTSRGSDVLDVAVVLVGFQYQARHFGAHRYRYVM